MSDNSKDKTYLTKWTKTELDMIKSLCCDTNDAQHFHYFLYKADQLKLNPLMGQIHSVLRKTDKRTGKETRTVITSIDGLRLLAERTNHYVPGEEVRFQYGDNSKVPTQAVVYVKKMDARGNWHNVPGIAYYDEYVQMKTDWETKEKVPNQIWSEKPHVMLGKCAESLALRRAFPTELSGIYTQEEMAATIAGDQGAIDLIDQPKDEGDSGLIEQHQVDNLAKLIGERHDIASRVLKHCGVAKIEELPKKQYEMLHRGIVNIFKKEQKSEPQNNNAELQHAN